MTRTHIHRKKKWYGARNSRQCRVSRKGWTNWIYYIKFYSTLQETISATQTRDHKVIWKQLYHCAKAATHIHSKGEKNASNLTSEIVFNSPRYFSCTII